LLSDYALFALSIISHIGKVTLCVRTTTLSLESRGEDKSNHLASSSATLLPPSHVTNHLAKLTTRYEERGKGKLEAERREEKGQRSAR
jgi:hypothetical protein